ncbi:hypothetical protein PIROE2DRAFT_9599 [Piromyces sp. E2]|nr:hypothetical protein PIROE2DRAFT_9599 [Piromyces sp. E2]|eukprot:OUM63797.1 hypothetical protein PIROE2DRAFT_9599 [Piromyces sp. E2]
MDYGFDLNSQESIAFANVIMENDDSNLTARALLQSWANNITKNLSEAASKNKMYYSHKSISSSLNHRKPRILSRMNTNISQIEKLENQLEKEKKLNRYKQEILEQKLKSDLEIYRKEYRVLKELEKKIKKPSGNIKDNKLKSSIRNKKSMIKSNSYLNEDDNDLLDLENKENINENKYTPKQNMSEKKEYSTVKRNKINNTIKDNKCNISSKKEEIIKSNNKNANQISNEQNESKSNNIQNTLLISTDKTINTDSLKNYTMDDMIHLIDDLIQKNTVNTNTDDDISNENGDILFEKVDDDMKSTEVIKEIDNNSDGTNINIDSTNKIIDENEEEDDDDDDNTVNNDDINNNKEDDNNEKKLIVTNNQEQKNNETRELEETGNGIMDNENNTIDIKNIPLIKKNIIPEKKEEPLDRTSIDSIYKMKVIIIIV